MVGGLSDHTPGTAVAVAAIALGACIIEKHFTLSRTEGGPDAAFSLEPEEFKRLVDDCRAAWSALGDITYDLQGSERGNKAFRRSIYAVATIEAGEAFSTQNVRSIRPGFGLPPKALPGLIGRRRSAGRVAEVRLQVVVDLEAGLADEPSIARPDRLIEHAAHRVEPVEDVMQPGADGCDIVARQADGGDLIGRGIDVLREVHAS